jgi:hypothetical protein
MRRFNIGRHAQLANAAQSGVNGMGSDAALPPEDRCRRNDRTASPFSTAWSRSRRCVGSAWRRLLDHHQPPRCWWWPPAAADSNPSDRPQPHEECLKAINQVSLTLIGYSSFCLLTLAGSDASMLGNRAEIDVPFANVRISFAGFLVVGPLTLIGLTAYLHLLAAHCLTGATFPVEHASLHAGGLLGIAPQPWPSLLLYWWAPAILTVFTWKAGPRPEAPLLGFLTATVTAWLVWLQIKRRPLGQRHWNIPLGVVFIALCGLAVLLGSGQLPINRSLNLYQASLERLDLSRFNLRYADLSMADLTGAFLSQANLEGAKLQAANLQGAILQGASLSKAQLSWAKGLSEADLRDVNFSGANLSWTDLHGSDLIGADLSAAILYKANLRGATIHQSTFYKADLRGADLRDADLFRVDLRGADLEGVIGLTREQLQEVILDTTTRLPHNLQLERTAQSHATPQSP